MFRPMRKQTLNKTKVWGKIDNRRVLSVTVAGVQAKKSNATPSYQYLALLTVFPVIAVGVAAYVL